MKKSHVIAELGGSVEAAKAVRSKDPLDVSETVSANYAACIAVPDDEVFVDLIELIQIAGEA